MREWSCDCDRWRRRTSIISQLHAKGAADVDLLRDCVAANFGDRDFFVRKAIGWALREYSKTDGEWVRRFVREHRGELSPLSAREALKWLEHVHLTKRSAWLIETRPGARHRNRGVTRSPQAPHEKAREAPAQAKNRCQPPKHEVVRILHSVADLEPVGRELPIGTVCP